MYTLEVSHNYESCLVCSDLHCDEKKECWQLRRVLSAAVSERVDCLVILGDLFDKLHRRIPASDLRGHLQRIIGDAELPRRVYYVTSLSSHDPIIPFPVELEVGFSRFLIVPGVIHLDVNGHEICGLHGDLVVSSGVLAYLMNKTASMTARKLLLEEIAKKKFCKSYEWTFTGHTHLPGIDWERKLGNAGSWKVSWHGSLPYWKPPSFTVIKVSSGEVKILRLNALEQRAGKR